MSKFISVCVLACFAFGSAACANMTKTQQGAVSGAAGGALLGAGIAAISGGRGTTGAVIGAVAGGLAGTIIGNTEEQRDNQPKAEAAHKSYDRGHIPSSEK